MSETSVEAFCVRALKKGLASYGKTIAVGRPNMETCGNIAHVTPMTFRKREK